MDISNVKKHETTLINVLSDLNTKINTIGKEFKQRIANEKEQAFRHVEATCTLDIDNKVQSMSVALVNLQAKYQQDIDTTTLESIKEHVYRECPVDEETQSLIADIRLEAETILNVEFVDTYFKVSTKSVDTETFLEYLTYLEQVRDNFLYFKKSKTTKYITRILEFIQDFKLHNSVAEHKHKKWFIFGFILLGLSFSRLFYSIYALLLCLVTFANVRRGYYMKQSLDVLKIVEDNLNNIREALDTKASKLHEEALQKLKSEFSTAHSELTKGIQQAKDESASTRQQALANFRFDDSALLNAQQELISSVKHEILTKTKEQQELQERATVLDREMKELVSAYEQEVDSVVERHLNFNGVGDSYIFPGKLLVEDSDPLKFFDKANYSNFFLYKDVDTVYNFIKLVCVQLRSLMNPNAFQIQLWDSVVAGIPFVAFKNPDVNGVDAGFVTHTTSGDIKDALAALETMLQKRMQVIKLNYETIGDYNRDMLELKAVPESYMIVFVLSTKSLEENEQFQRLVVNGAEVGIYIYSFVPSTEVSEKHFSLVNNSDYCAHLGNGALNPSASVAMKESISAIVAAN